MALLGSELSLDENHGCWPSIIGTVRQKQINWAIDLIQETWKRCRVAYVIRGQIGADDLAADKIKAEMELAPRAPIALGFMLFLKPFAQTKDFQSGAINRQMDRGLPKPLLMP